jgi:hypothetical protein
VPQIEKWAASSGHTLEKGWKVPLAIAVKRKLLSQEIKKLDGKQVDDWGRLFDDFFERKQD